MPSVTPRTNVARLWMLAPTKSRNHAQSPCKRLPPRAEVGPKREVRPESYEREMAPQSTVTKLREERYCGRKGGGGSGGRGESVWFWVGAGSDGLFRAHLEKNKDAAECERDRLQWRYRISRRPGKVKRSGLKGVHSGARTRSPFLMNTPTQIPLTVPNPRSRMLRMLSASVKSDGSSAGGSKGERSERTKTPKRPQLTS